MYWSVWHIIGIERISQQTSWLPSFPVSWAAHCPAMAPRPSPGLVLLDQRPLYKWHDLQPGSGHPEASPLVIGWAWLSGQRPRGQPKHPECRDGKREPETLLCSGADDDGGSPKLTWRGSRLRSTASQARAAVDGSPHLKYQMWICLEGSDHLGSIAWWTRAYILKTDCLGFNSCSAIFWICDSG